MPDLTLIIPLLLLVALMFFMWRGNKKRQAQQEEMRSQLIPGTEVMTQAGIYGTIVEVDEDNNIMTIESTPGTLLRVHSMTVVNVVTPQIPDDASSLTEQIDAQQEQNTDGRDSAAPEQNSQQDAADADAAAGDDRDDSTKR